MATPVTRDVLQRRMRKLAVDTIRARSRRDFIAKMGIVEEETDETAFWLELLEECRLAPTARLAPLSREAGELLAITVASIRTARMGRGVSRANPQSAIRNPQCS